MLQSLNEDSNGHKKKHKNVLKQQKSTKMFLTSFVLLNDAEI